MFLRLYFLLPDENTTEKVVDDLTETGIELRNLHAHVKQDSSNHLPATVVGKKWIWPKAWKM